MQPKCNQMCLAAGRHWLPLLSWGALVVMMGEARVRCLLGQIDRWRKNLDAW